VSGRLTGDYAKLERLQRGVQELASSGFTETMEGWAERGSQLVQEGFDQARAPDGSAWEATDAGNKPLHGPSGDLEAAAVEVEPFKRGIRVKIGLAYAAIHQWGGRAGRNHSVWIDARPYLPPERPPDLPASWERALHDSLKRVIFKHTR
jgi:phage gpG-like protein